MLCVSLAAGAGCFERARCQVDDECAGGEVCYPDGRCLSHQVALRAGAPPGHDCLHGTRCPRDASCNNGYCPPEPAPVDMVPPLFEGLIDAYPDGDGVILLYFALPQDNVTPPSEIEVEIRRSEVAGGAAAAPVLITVKGLESFRDLGLNVGTTYYYTARARDGAGLVSGFGVEVVATARAWPVLAPGVDYETQIQPLLNARCTRCHGGLGGLQLSSFANLSLGGLHGPVLVACQPENSNLAGKLGPGPPFGSRMPRDGPPWLSLDEVALVRRWIADGAEQTYRPGACPP